MSYTKTTWVNNTTPINETNLNKIEKGIYDNSLITEAIADKLNPTDTETYKTAELTEGQITDVIGVKDIIIKGQTSQDGTPTPSAPVDVNVVSGSNVINTSSKNLFDGILENSGFQGTGLNAEVNTKRIRNKNYIRVKENQTYTINITEYNTTKGTISINISYYNKNDYSTVRLSESGWKNLPYTFITPENCKFIRFLCKITSSSEESEIVYTDVNKVQLEQNSTATTYEPHQGKELHLDLGSIELCKIGNYQDYFYKSGSKWYLHKEIEKLTGNDIISTLAFAESTSYSDSTYLCCYNNGFINTKYLNTIAYCNKFNGQYHYVEKKVANSLRMSSTSLGICVLKSDFATVNDLNSYFNTNGNDIFVYMVLKTPTNTEITDTTLISQLEAIYNAPLYEETNITQINNDLPMVLDITACKDNINGIKAFIRK